MIHDQRALALALLALAWLGCAEGPAPSTSADAAPPIDAARADRSLVDALVLPVDAAVPVVDATPPCPEICASGERRCQAGAVEICADYDGDGCLTWGGAVACPAGAACEEGACVATCAHACAEGEIVCGGGGVRRCVADAEGCRALSAPEPCAEGERCDDGACVPEVRPCEDGCDEDGARACHEGGYRVCGQHDEDPCLEWSITVPCGEGERCAAGECLPTCQDDCAVGEARCEGEGFVTCGSFDADECLEFGAVLPCAEGERCDGGACVSVEIPCEDACEADGAQICAEDGFQRCGQYDADACLDLSSVVACGAREACEAGACVALCEDECAGQATRCVEGGVQRCGGFDLDPCLEWSPTAACPANHLCDDGACVDQGAPCEDACAAGAVRCGEGGVESCGQHDEDECLEWSAASPCPAGERCEAGACAPDCADECVEGEATCVAGALATCGQHDEDPCLEMGGAAPCPDGQSCVEGACVDVCRDECQPDAVRCSPDTDGVQRCGPSDLDDCLHWGSPTPCDAREDCQAGACVAICQDECAPEARRCVGDSFEVCGDYDADPCFDFGGTTPCGAGEICAAGACNSTCEDECPEEGAVECVDAAQTRACGNFDGDACLEWSVPQACRDAERCAGGVCEIVPASVLINEVYYDGPSTTDPQVAFIELWSGPGADLAGHRLVAINGANETVYAELDLSGQRLEPDGYLVIAGPDAEAPLAAIAGLIWGAADLQNGPDALQLWAGDARVDALAYGVSDYEGLGEGAPAEDVSGGIALSRNEAHADTQDNSADFIAQEPSPGAAAPEACQDACEADATRCEADRLERCADAGGCLAWGLVEDCAAANALCVDPAEGCTLCGNGVVDEGEACDGGEGCDAGCALAMGPALEQFQRLFVFGEDEESQLAPQEPEAILPAPGGGWYIAGWGGWNWSPNYYGLILRVGPDGALIWARELGEAGRDDWIHEMIALPDGDLIVVGATESYGAGEADAYMARVSPLGEVRWQRAWGSEFEDVLYGVTLTEAGELLAVGWTEAFPRSSRVDVLALWVSTDGALRRAHAYTGDGTKWDKGFGVANLPEGGALIVANSDSWNASIEDDLLLVRLDADARVTGADEYGAANLQIRGVDRAPDGDLLITGADDGSMYLARVTLDGELRLQRVYLNDYATLRAATEDAAGRTVAVGRDVDLYWTRVGIPDQTISANFLRDEGAISGNREASAVAATEDGGLLIAGRTNDGGLWLIKANAEDETAGCNAWGGFSTNNNTRSSSPRARTITRLDLDWPTAVIEGPLTAPVVTEQLMCASPAP